MSKTSGQAVPLYRCEGDTCVLGEEGVPGFFTSEEEEPTCPACKSTDVHKEEKPHVHQAGDDPYEDLHIEVQIALLRKQIQPDEAQEFFLRLVTEKEEKE